MKKQVLAGIPESHHIIFLGDLLLHVSSFKSMAAILLKDFLAIRHAKLRLNLAKCSLPQWSAKVLGHVVYEQGITADPEKVHPTVCNRAMQLLGLGLLPSGSQGTSID